MGKVKQAIYVERVPEFFEKDGMFHIRFAGVAEFVMSPSRFIDVHRAAAELMARWQVDQLEKVAPIQRKRR